MAFYKPRPALSTLVLLLAAVLAACGGEAVVTVTPTATPTPRPSPTATSVPPTATATPEPPTPTIEPPTPTAEPPTPTVEPPPPTALPLTETPAPPLPKPFIPSPMPPAPDSAEVLPSEVLQGGTVIVRAGAGNAVSGVAQFEGRQYPLVRAGDVLWGIIGLPANQSSGPQTVFLSLVDAQGVTVEELSIGFSVVTAGYPVEYVTLPPDRAGLLAPDIVQEELAFRAAIFDVFTPERLWSGPFLLPVDGPLTSPYGVGRSYNGAPVVDYHHGADFSAPPGTPIVAANSGRVAFAGELAIRGISVFIDHGLGVFSSYHHIVNQGDLVGYVGDTGLAEGAHLHWEIAVRGVNVDPLPWTQVEYGP